MKEGDEWGKIKFKELPNKSMAYSCMDKEERKLYNKILEIKNKQINKAYKVKSMCETLIEYFKLSDNVRERIYEYIKTMEQFLTSSRIYEETWACSLIYIASILENERVTQEELCRATGTMESTIRKGYRILVDYFNLEEGVAKRGDE